MSEPEFLDDIEATKRFDTKEVQKILDEQMKEKENGSSDDEGEDTGKSSKEDTGKSEPEKGKGSKRGKKGKDGKEEIKPVWKDILEMFIYFVAVLVVSLLIVTFVGQRTVVEGSSMNPTLTDGDSLFVDKISYRFADPKRFDVIVFPYQHAKKTYYIKRIIALPGEDVFINAEGTIYINGKVLEEDYGNEVILNPGRAETTITMGPDEYFVMGDNRNNSSDSRDAMVGNINRKDIIGKAFVRIYPFKDFGLVKNLGKNAKE